MSHGPTYYASKGACIYCGCTVPKLTNEHIVPYSLGGVHVIREASCNDCSDITKLFEQRVAKDLWGDARNAFDAPSRRKKERKPYILMPDPDNPGRNRKVRREDFPAFLIFYKMHRAGLLEGLPETVDTSDRWSFSAVDDDKRTRMFESQNPGKLTVQFRNVPLEFGRLLAKIGYCQVLTTLDPADFHPVCLPYITGEKNNVSYVVGGSRDELKPVPDHGYCLSTVGFGDQESLMLVALVRLYANTYSPQYHVVVGSVLGQDHVLRVLRKFEASGVNLNVKNFHTLRNTLETHWHPAVYPLPYWQVKQVNRSIKP